MGPTQDESPARQTLIEYDRPDDETLELSLIRAFERLGVGPMDHAKPLQELVDVDALRRLHEGSATVPVRTTLRIEGHPVTVTADAVRIHPETG